MPQTAKLFMTGRSQAVRLPKEFRFEGKEVFIHKEAGRVILSEKPESWDDFFNFLDTADIPEDFMADRDDDPLQERDLF